MAICKNCIHHNVCYRIEHYGRDMEDDEPCKDFMPAADVEAAAKMDENGTAARSKHKHEYKTVLLHHKYSRSKPHEQDPLIVDYLSATKVCQICGRIGVTDHDYYEAGTFGGWLTSPKLIPAAQDLDKWCVNECFGTFAHKEM